MKVKGLINSPFEGFDWSVLDSPEFQEDAVREEIITPFLWTLGYKVTPPNKILRSKRLEHPFVALGTTQHRISLVPDYLMFANGRPAWILDAKSPKESVTDPAHEGQAYSYVCHRDVRADWYAVCNGRELAAFHVADMCKEPRLRVSFDRLADHWGDIWQALAPDFVHEKRGSYLKDFGVHLLKMGLTREVQIHFLNVVIGTLARVGESVFSINGVVNFEDRQYFVTFDFDRERLNQLTPLLPPKMAGAVEPCFTTFPSMIKVQGDEIPPVSATVRLAAKILENEAEHYLPLEVIEFRSVP